MKRTGIWAIVSVAVVLCLLMVSFGCAAPAPAGPKVFNWKWSSVSAPEYAGDKTVVWLIDEVNKRCKDQINLELYSGNALGFGATGQLDALKDNLVQMAYLPFPHIEGQVPEPSGLDLPRFYPADDWELRPTWTKELLPLVNDILKPYDVTVLAFLPDAARALACNKPVSGLADIQKMKVRAMGAMEADAFARLGISSTSMSPAEVYTGLQQGVIDAAGCPYLYIYLQKWPEVAPYIYNWSLNTASVSIAVSDTALNELPKDMQDAMMDLQPELIVKMRDFFEEDDIAAGQKLIEAECTFTELSESDAAKINSILFPMWEEWYENTSPAGKKLFEKAVKVLKVAGYDRSVPK